jgi:hypothetical protein
MWIESIIYDEPLRGGLPLLSPGSYSSFIANIFTYEAHRKIDGDSTNFARKLNKAHKLYNDNRLFPWLTPIFGEAQDATTIRLTSILATLLTLSCILTQLDSCCKTVQSFSLAISCTFCSKNSCRRLPSYCQSGYISLASILRRE